jgi:AcrR family transcriptional regulator
MSSDERRRAVLDAAERVFLRFGFRRTTMGDIAKEAGLSRPALYLVLPSKEEIFEAVFARVCEAELEEMRARVAAAPSAGEKLMGALEIWCVRNYELTHGSPGAADLYESSREVAAAVSVKANAAFEALVAEIVEPLVRKQSRLGLSALEVARVVSGAIVGLKGAAKNAKQLRTSVRHLLAVVLASLGQTL